MNWTAAQDKAVQKDAQDKLKNFRDHFQLPKSSGHEPLYFVGHSLGLMPKKSKDYVNQELDRWGDLAVEGHFLGDHPWLDYADDLGALSAKLVGAKSSEVFLAATLSSNIHHLFASFYRPSKKRYKVLMEAHAFPSDVYAVKSQLKFHGHDPEQGIILLENSSDQSLQDLFQKYGDEIALVWVGQPNYLSGEVFNTQLLAELAHQKGAFIGLDLAHGVGNLDLNLHDEHIDFACWCTYKYLNGGPGCIGGIYIHERHHPATEIPRLEGWFGNEVQSRFLMEPTFRPYKDARAWQLSNPPIWPLASLRASLEIFDQAGIKNIRQKALELTDFMQELIRDFLPGKIESVTPKEATRRGNMLCLKVCDGDPKKLEKFLRKNDVFCDFREPNILRMAPVALYTRFIDVFNLIKIMAKYFEQA